MDCVTVEKISGVALKVAPFGVIEIDRSYWSAKTAWLPNSDIRRARVIINLNFLRPIIRAITTPLA